MKKSLFLFFLMGLLWTACKKDNIEPSGGTGTPPNTTIPYVVTIGTPTPQDGQTVTANQTTPIRITFSNSDTIHWVKVLLTLPSGIEAKLIEQDVERATSYTYETNYFLSESGTYNLYAESAGHDGEEGKQTISTSFIAQ